MPVEQEALIGQPNVNSAVNYALDDSPKCGKASVTKIQFLIGVGKYIFPERRDFFWTGFWSRFTEFPHFFPAVIWGIIHITIHKWGAYSLQIEGHYCTKSKTLKNDLLMCGK